MKNMIFKILKVGFVLSLISATSSIATGFTDDHSDGSLTGWTIEGGRGWNETNGAANPQNGNMSIGYLVNDYACNDNGTFEVNITCDQWSGNYGGVVFRYNTTSSFYFASVKPGSVGSGEVRFNKNSTSSTGSSLVASGLTMGTTFTLKIDMNGSNFKFYIDGNYVGEITDSDHASGKVGYGYDAQWNDYIDYNGSSWSDDVPTNVAPSDVYLSNNTVDENKIIGTVVGIFSSEDLNTDDNHTYTLVSGSSDFTIEGAVLKTSAQFNYAVQNTYSITVRSTDDGEGNLYFEKEFIVYVNAEEDYSLWSYSSNLYFNTTASGADITSNLNNFPILLELNSTNFDFTQTQSNGEDIRFSDADGSHIPYEIEKWDSQNQLAKVWIKVPQIDGNSMQDYISVFWGKSNATDKSDSREVFMSQDGFIGTWHLNGDFKDATNAEHDGINSGATNIECFVGNGANITSNSFVDISSINSNLNATTGTFSAWINLSASIITDDSIRGIVEIGDVNNSTRMIGLRKRNSTEIAMQYRVNGTNYNAIISDLTGFADSWKYITGVYDANNVYIYSDGILISQIDRSANGDIAISELDQAFIGSDAEAAQNYFYNGNIDEVRIENVTRSADWIKLSYLNQNNTNGVLSFASFVSTVNPPTSFTATPTGNDINITWVDQSDNEDGFEISYGTAQDNMQFLATVSANSNSFTHLIGSCGVKYYYSIKAYNSNGESALVEAIGYTTPCVPTNIQATVVSETEINVTWSGNSEEYILVSGDGDGNWSEIYRGGNTSFNNTGLTCGQYREYKVQGVIPNDSTSEFTSITSTTTTYCEVSNPTNLAANASMPGEISLSWVDNASNELGFKVFRREATGSFVEIEDYLPANTSIYMDNTVKCDYDYSYYVKAFDAFTVSSPSNTVETHSIYCGAGKNTSEMISLIGMYLESDNTPVSGERIVLVKIYNNRFGQGNPIYEELFEGILVKNGFFTVAVGLTDDVATPIRENESLYYDVIIDGASIYGNTVQPLTASPYAISDAYHLNGTGAPTSGISAPVGAFYIDTDPASLKLYIKFGINDIDWIEVRQ